MTAVWGEPELDITELMEGVVGKCFLCHTPVKFRDCLVWSRFLNKIVCVECGVRGVCPSSEQGWLEL